MRCRSAGALLLVATAAAIGAARADAQTTVRVADPAHAPSARLLRSALSGAHHVMRADSARRLVLPRTAEVGATAIVIGGDVAVGADVEGDVVVVGGDLFLRPGASIRGRAVAIGGAVYGSTLAHVAGGIHSYRDHTYDAVTEGNEIVLVHRPLGVGEPRFELPIAEGLRVPAYDRVDGLVLPWGPVLRPTAGVELEPFITYRSHLGAWDPSLHARVQLAEPWRLTIDAGRTTRTNDAWIYSEPINTVLSLFSGSDIRNYYRADRAEVAIGRVDQRPGVELETYAGLLTERAWSVGSPDSLGSRPWSAFGNDDPERMARGNPPVDRGRISSAFLGAVARWDAQDLRAVLSARVESPWEAPDDRRFVQLTLDGTVGFPTFGTQSFRIDAHLVTTAADSTPRQRYAYLGGSGTLPVIEDPLSLGGDQLLFFDSRYDIPITRVRLPYVGSPVFSLRHRVGTAGVAGLPRLTQNVGVRVSWSFLRADYSIDPATGRREVKLGLTFAR